VEILFVIAVIVVLCLVLGVKKIYLIFGALVLIGLAYAATVILLSVFFVIMILSKKKEAVFSRIDKSPKSRFNVAYYKIDEKEYPNIFPEEGFMRTKLYKSDKPCHVLLSRNGKFVFDKFSCTTCTIGFILGVGTVIAAALIMMQMK
jgi:hypothetical protein